MKRGFKIVGMIAAALCVVWVVGQAFGLVNMPSDTGVVAGAVILLLCVVGGIGVIEWIVLKIKRSLTEGEKKK